MRKGISMALFFVLGMYTINAQKDQQGVFMTLDMQPVLQLEMSSPEQINFVFNSVKDYQEGITHNAATTLKVTSTVKWDLYAVGRSKGKSPNGSTFWDQEKSFGSSYNSVADIPLSLLELKQNNKNKAAKAGNGLYGDYSQNFTNGNGGNSLYVANDGSLTPPSKNGKYIAGHSGVLDGEDSDYMDSGSYYSRYSKTSDFEYIIDYRIFPGYPAIFPNAFNADATIAENVVASANANAVLAGGVEGAGNNSYAESGVYTMYVQYVLLEDQ